MVIVADDFIARWGIVAALRSLGITNVVDCAGNELAALMDSRSVDLAVIVAESPGRLDRYEVLSAVTPVLAAHDECVGIVVARARDPLVRLRIAESGARLLVDYGAVAAEPALLADVLDDSSGAWHVPTRWELREAEGLAWDGELDPFLAVARTCPPEVWGSEAKQACLPISRRQLLRLRRLAMEQAGLPRPDYRRYTTSLRSAPEFPEWSSVRLFAQRLLGLACIPATPGGAREIAPRRATSGP